MRAKWEQDKCVSVRASALKTSCGCMCQRDQMWWCVYQCGCIWERLCLYLRKGECDWVREQKGVCKWVCVGAYVWVWLGVCVSDEVILVSLILARLHCHFSPIVRVWLFERLFGFHFHEFDWKCQSRSFSQFPIDSRTNKNKNFFSFKYQTSFRKEIDRQTTNA